LKEDWIWDRQRSERYVRIIGIAPLKEEFRDGESIGYQPLFWLYYPECREVFAHSEAFNLFNDAQRRTYEDLFQKRYFSSYIVKESNVYDRIVKGYVRGMDALAESERIKEELFLLEHDLWHY
jgi:gliding motility associated protien GldN